ncbi:LysM peptidoglycan-binding domain-containing protein [Spartinivicinus ruber]|uniref:LysM peptidoglycan-binding domain-containing protein n=1 Tax=Spartinivicinus ruber TaxID=2683272 RepID=UPI0013D16759|nr:LysM peptidoglycan-binding domain-containing protein [Spartinivicinus ruber]
MVAVIAGQDLGLHNNVLAGLGGNSQLGEGNNRVFINHQTGNLVVRHHTDAVASVGLDTTLLHTYNSQGQTNDPRHNPWLLGLNRFISQLPEPPNEPGSSLIKQNGDGSDSVYRYDEKLQAYITTDGEGAHDYFQYDQTSQTWTWTEGTSRVTETYNAQGQLIQLTDKAGNQTQLSYLNNKLSTITDASGQVTSLIYTDNLLTEVQVAYPNQAGQQISQVVSRYQYDEQNRLSHVIVDLTPADNSITDGQTYQTQYRYDGNSQRIKTIHNSDGTALTFTYEQVNGTYRVASYRDATGVGVDYQYDVAQQITHVTNTLGHQTSYQFDDQGRITQVFTPAVDGQRDTIAYQYDEQDNITQITNGLGDRISRQYDSMGNLTYEIDSENRVSHYQYNTQQQLIAEATWQLQRAPTTPAEFTAIPENAAFTRHLYNSQGLRQFTLSAEGRVSAFQYDSQGQLIETYQLAGVVYPIASPEETESEITLTAVSDWVNAQLANGQATKLTQTLTEYDSRGLINKVVKQGTDKNGAAQSIETVFNYDHFGRLLSTANAEGATETLSYDGLGRVLSKTNQAGLTTVYRYDDQNHLVTTTFASGLVKTELFDAAGRLLSRTEQATDDTQTLGKVRYFYDQAGRQIAMQDANGGRSYTLYDTRNRKVATIDSLGAMVEYRYDANNQLIEQIQYHQQVNTRGLVMGGQINEQKLVLDTLRPASSATADRHSYWVYDTAGQKRFAINGQGQVKEWVYNAHGKVVGEHQYEAPLATSLLGQRLTVAEVQANLGDYTPIVVRNSSTTPWETTYKASAYQLGASEQTTETVKSYATLQLSGSSSYQMVDSIPNHVTVIKQQNKADITGTILVNYLTDEEQASVDKIVVDFIDLKTRQSKRVTTDPAQFDNYQGELILPSHLTGGRYRASVVVYLQNGERIAKPTFVIEKGRHQFISQTIRWPVDALANQPGTKHQIEYRPLDRPPFGLTATAPFKTVAVEIVDGFYQATLEEVVPNLPYEVRLVHQQDASNIDNEQLTEKSGTFLLVPTSRDSTQNIEFSQAAVNSQTVEGASLTGIISAEEAKKIDYISTYVDSVGSQSEEVSHALTYPRGYRHYQGEVNLSLGRELDSGTYRISMTKYYYDGTRAEESFVYQVGNQQEINYHTRLTIPLDQLPLAVTKPGTTVAYRLAQQEPSQYEFVDLASQLSADKQAIELALTDLIAGRNDLTIKIVQDGDPVIEREGHARITVDGYSKKQVLLKFSDENGDKIAGRFNHHFYNDDQQLIGSIDAEGYLTEIIYNEAGQKVSEIRYATKTPYVVSQQFSHSLEHLRPAASDQDQRTFFIYDSFGRQVATIDAEGYLTEQIFDSLGRLSQTIRYQKPLAVLKKEPLAVLKNEPLAVFNNQPLAEAALNSPATEQSLVELRQLATDPQQTKWVEQFRYDQAGRKIQSIDRFGVVTQYQYDPLSNLTTVVTGEDQARSKAVVQQRRFDQKGRVIAELTAEGSQLLKTATTDQAKAQIWQTHSNQFVYNDAGLKIKVIQPQAENGQQPTSYFYYDRSHQLRYTINSLGEVTEHRYNGFGEKIKTIRYQTRISTEGLTGGWDNSRQLKDIQTSAEDITTQQAFNRLGQKTLTVDGEGGISRLAYNSFGELSEFTKSIQAANEAYTTTRTYYDKRGQLIRSVAGEGADQQISHNAYDAFGRLTTKTFADGNVAQTAYDRLNRVVAEVTDSGNKTQFRYDALGRKVQVTDPLGQVTQYQYDDQQRTLSVTSPGGHTVKTWSNQHGEALKVQDPNGNSKQYQYDAAGRLTKTEFFDAQGNLLQTSEKQFNQLGWLTETTDKQGITRQFSYDAEGRKIQEVVDPTGFKLTTRYTLDAQGRVISQSGPDRLTSTRTTYDANGRVTEIISGSKFRGVQLFTRYRYDELGNQVAVEKGSLETGVESTVHYEYDSLGRKTAQIIDPEGLALRTDYQYDQRNNVIVETDANGDSTYYAYNGNNQLRYMVDGNGGVSVIEYDNAGRKIIERQLAKPITIEGLAADLINHSGDSRVAVEGRVSARPKPQLTEKNHVSYTLYDKDGRVAYQFNSVGHAVGFQYDANGNIIQENKYTTPVSNVEHLFVGQQFDQLIEQLESQQPISSYQFYNGLNQPVVTINAAGYVAVNHYDENGRLAGTTQYSLHFEDDLNIQPEQLANLNLAELSEKVSQFLSANDDVAKQTSQIIYDSLGRKQYQIDAAGYISEFQYDINSRITASLQYKTPINLPAHLGGTGPEFITAEVIAAHIAEHNETAAFQQHVYDKAGREIYTIDAQGHVTEKLYDGLGRVIETRRYQGIIAYQSKPSSFQTARKLGQLDYVVSRTVYDQAGRATFEIDPLGHVTQHEYDGVGQLIRSVRYAKPIALSQTTASLNTTEVDSLLVAADNDQSTVYQYDAAGNKTGLLTGAASVLKADMTVEEIKTAIQQHKIRVEYYEYDALGQRTAIHRQTETGEWLTLFHYDGKGQLVRELKQVDADNGYLTVFDYDAFGNKVFENRYSGLLPISKGANQSRSLVYADRIVRFRYDGLNRLIAETAPSADGNGHETHYVYDAFGNLTSKIEAAGKQSERHTEYRYDDRNQKIAEIKAAGTEAAAETRYQYDSLGRLTTIIDARGVALISQDSDWALAERAKLGMTHTVQNEAGEDVPGATKRAHELTDDEIRTLLAAYTSTQTFDAAGHKTSETDALGYVTRTEYDAFGNIIKATDPKGAEGYFYYDANNRLRLQIGPSGYATETRYNAFGQVVETLRYQQPLSGSIGSYDENTALNDLLTQLNSQTGVLSKQNQINGFGQITAVTEAGVTETFSYDAQGNKLSHTDRNGNTTQFEYDAQGRLIKQYSPQVRVVTNAETGAVAMQSVVTQYDYDYLDNKVRTTVGVGSNTPLITEMDYDPQGRLITQRKAQHWVEDGQSGGGKNTIPEVQRRYDAVGNVITETDANGNTSTFYYNARNLVIAKVDGEGYLTEFSYDAAGNKLTERVYDTSVGTVYPNSQPVGQGQYRETTFAVDANNREVAQYSRTVLMHDIDKGYFYGRKAQHQVYDANGNVIKVIDGRGNASFNYYDATGNVILTVDPLGYATAKSYNPASQQIEEIKFAQSLTAEQLANLSEQSDPQPLLDSLDKNAANNRITRQQYDALGRLIETRQVNVEHQVKVGNEWQTHTGDAITQLLYDANGNNVAIIRKGETTAGEATGPAERIDIGYDALNRKVLEQSTGYTAASGETVRQTTSTYYNAQGQQALVVQEQADGKQTQFELSAGDLITRLIYDKAGNAIKQIDANGSATELFYDGNGNVVRKRQHLLQADGTTKAVDMRLAYDSYNREVWRDEGIGAIKHVWHNAHGQITGKGINGQIQEYYEYDQAGNLVKTNEKNGAPRLYLYDENGNVSQEIQSQAIDLSTITLSEIRTLDASKLHITLSRYDARNQLTDVIQPEMSFLTGTDSTTPAEQVVEATPYTFGKASMSGGEAFQMRFSLKARPRRSNKPQVHYDIRSVQFNWKDVNNAPTKFKLDWDSGFTWKSRGVSQFTANQSTGSVNFGTRGSRSYKTTRSNIYSQGMIYRFNLYKDNGNGKYTPLLTNAKGRYHWTGSGPSGTRYEDGQVHYAPQIINLEQQPKETTRLRFYYRVAQDPGYASREYNEANYQPEKYSFQVTGSRVRRNGGHWAVDMSNAPGLKENQTYEYFYEAVNAQGNVMNRAEGIFKTNENAQSGETFDLQLNMTQTAATPASETNAEAKPSEQQLDTIYLSWKNLGNYTGKLRFDWDAGFAGAKGSTEVDASQQSIQLTPNTKLQSAEGRVFTYTINVYKQNTAGEWELLDWLRGDYSFKGKRFESGTYTATGHHELDRHQGIKKGSITHRNTGRPPYHRNSLDYLIGKQALVSHAVHRQQAYNAFGEIIKEVDGNEKVTHFTYNQLGKMVLKQAPEVSATDEQGNKQQVTPTTRYGYDLFGQQLSTTDANGNTNEQQWAAGHITGELHADGGQVQQQYDEFGHKVKQTNELDLVTTYGYDQVGNITQVNRAGGNNDTYSYDAAGQQVSHTNALGKTEHYQYDSSGRVLSHTDYAGFTTTYQYEYNGSIGEIGGWVVTNTNAEEKTLIDHKDVFDRIHYHEDLGGRKFWYKYNSAGKLLWQKGDTNLENELEHDQEIYYGYYNNGYIKNIDDLGANNYSEFKYDKNGNLIFEAYYNIDEDQGQKRVYTQRSNVEYDALNRITKIDDPKYTITYEYDTMGNRRNVRSEYIQVDQDPVAAETDPGLKKHVQAFWYTYDAMNRFTTTMGTLKDGQIVAGDHGYQISYNAAGQRVQATSKNNTEVYAYDENGKLTTTHIDGVLRARRVNDVVGNTTLYGEYDQQGNLYREVSKEYDANNRAIKETTTTEKGESSSKGTTFEYDKVGNLKVTATFGDDPVIKTHYSYELWDEYKRKTIRSQAKTGQELRWVWQPGTSTFGYDQNGHINYVEDEYNARILKYINNHKGQVLTRTEEGHQRDGTQYLRTHQFYYMNGVGIGDVGDDGPTYTDYATQLAYNQGLMRRPDKVTPVFSADFDANYRAIGENYPAQSPGVYTIKKGDSLQSIALALWGDSSLWFLLADANGLKPEQIANLKPGTVLTVPNKVTNIHNNSSTFRPYDAGVAIGDVSPTLPDVPPPPAPKGGGCGAAQVIIIVVAIVATIFTAGAAGAAFGAMAAGTSATAAAGGLVASGFAATMSAGLATLSTLSWASVGAAFVAGTVGSIAGQAAGVALGVQDKISFKQAAKAGLQTGISTVVGGAVGEYFSTASGLGKTVFGAGKQVNSWQAAARAAVGNIGTQALSMQSGLQKKFDWRSTAVASISAGISRGLNNADYRTDNLAVDTTTDTLISEGVEAAIYKRKFDVNSFAGNSIGHSIKAYYRPQSSSIVNESAKENQHGSESKKAYGVESEIIQTDLEKLFSYDPKEELKQVNPDVINQGLAEDYTQQIVEEIKIDEQLNGRLEGYSYNQKKAFLNSVGEAYPDYDVSQSSQAKSAAGLYARSGFRKIGVGTNWQERNDQNYQAYLANFEPDPVGESKAEQINQVKGYIKPLYNESPKDFHTRTIEIVNNFELALSVDKEIGIEHGKEGLAFFGGNEKHQNKLVAAVKKEDLLEFATVTNRGDIVEDYNSVENMHPIDVVKHWALGYGGNLHFSPESRVSKIFSQGDGAKLLEDRFYNKFAGNPPDLGEMNKVDYKYTWFWRAFNLNSAEQVVGTWKGEAIRHGNEVVFRAKNNMSLNSLTFGRQRSETGWDWLNPEILGPNEGDLYMTIEWSRPLRSK